MNPPPFLHLFEEASPPVVTSLHDVLGNTGEIRTRLSWHGALSQKPSVPRPTERVCRSSPPSVSGRGSDPVSFPAVGRRYVGSFNARYRRTGTLWEGRFKAALVDTARYVLACYRYIELNPVRAMMVEEPSGYPWTSYHANALGQPNPLLTPHDTYLALGENATARQSAYRAWVTDTFDDAEWSELRQHTQQQRAWGSDHFRQQVEALTLRAATVRPRGRPRKPPAAEEK